MGLETTLAALADIEMDSGMSVVNVFTPADGKQTLASGEVPARILTPVSSAEEGKQQLTVTGQVQQVEWRVADRLLYQQSGEGEGLEDVLGVLTAYVDAYHAALKAMRFKLGNGARVGSIATDMGTYLYPSNSDQEYFGVEVTLEIKEML